MAIIPKIKKLLTPITLWLATLVLVATVLLLVEADLLWKVQQHNVFLDTTLFFQQMMAKPGGLLEWLSTYFSQHFYYLWLGVIILSGWWLVLMWLTKRAFNIPDRWTVLTIVPVAILIVANMCLGYWVYVIKQPGYFYMATIGTTALAALLWAYRIFNKEWCADSKFTILHSSFFIFIILLCVVGYPLLGVYALAAAALMAIMTWRMKHITIKYKVLISLVALVSIVAVPLFYYRFVYCGTNSIDLWRTGIPVFEVADSYPMYYLPYYALGLCFLLFAATYQEKELQTHSSAEAKPKTKKQSKNQKKKGTTFISYIIPVASYIVIAGAVYYFWYKDANFHHELRMQRCVEQTDWEGVVAEGTKQQGEPTRAIVMMHNLALSRLGRQCNEMYRFPKGSKKSNTPLPIFMYNVSGRMMLYQYGAMNECHRVCMEEGVEYGWNVEQLQYLARAAIFNKEPQAARKFLNILRQTSYYGEWADHMETLLNDPKQLAQDSETGPITHMMHYTDRLDAVEGYVEKTLMNNLACQDADDIYFQEQAVLAAMWTRDPALFWPRFEHYVKLNGEDNMPPRIFQEAAWLFANMQGQEGLDEWVLEPGVKEGLQSFMKQMQHFRKTPSPSAKNYMLAYFGTTYYFEYFFLKDITYY